MRGASCKACSLEGKKLCASLWLLLLASCSNTPTYLLCCLLLPRRIKSSSHSERNQAIFTLGRWENKAVLLALMFLEAATVMASQNIASQRERNSVFKEQAAPCTFHTQNVFMPAPASTCLVWHLAYFKHFLNLALYRISETRLAMLYLAVSLVNVMTSIGLCKNRIMFPRTPPHSWCRSLQDTNGFQCAVQDIRALARRPHSVSQSRYTDDGCDRICAEYVQGDFDRIVVGAACPEKKRASLLKMLKPQGGILVSPMIGSTLDKSVKKADGSTNTTCLSIVRFKDLEVGSYPQTIRIFGFTILLWPA